MDAEKQTEREEPGMYRHEVYRANCRFKIENAIQCGLDEGLYRVTWKANDGQSGTEEGYDYLAIIRRISDSLPQLDNFRYPFLPVSREGSEA
jgi:hypothetical protein